VGGPTLLTAEFAELAGADGMGAWVVSPYPLPGELPDADAWVEAYRSVGPHVPDPGAYAWPTYATVHALADALTEVIQGEGEPAREGVASYDPEPVLNRRLFVYRWSEEGLHYVAP
jgi:ABC-type branched-subunit amino acid transport system substrate-binding protein